MCLQLVERYAVCGCVYHRHAVDQCAAANQRGHVVRVREIRVGYICPQHAPQGPSGGSSASSTRYPDSGYSSGCYSGSGYRS